MKYLSKELLVERMRDDSDVSVVCGSRALSLSRAELNCRNSGLAIAASLLLLFSSVTAVAQSRPQPPPVSPDPIDIEKPKPRDDSHSMGTPEEEMKIKQSIKYLEEEYKHNVERAKEAATLGAELRDTVKSGKPFGREETKKLDRLEKLAKKIRDEAGGSDEESTIANPPGKLDSALSRMADVAETLYKSVEKTPRQVISATVIENANALLKLAKLTRNLFH